MVSAILFGWYADFGKALTLFNGHPNRFILTNGKHPIFPNFLKLHKLQKIFEGYTHNSLQK